MSSEYTYPDSVLTRIDEVVDLLSNTKTQISAEKFRIAAIIALLAALGLNIWGFIAQTTGFMVIWISASLYFYLFYPMLPMFLFPFRYLTETFPPLTS